MSVAVGLRALVCMHAVPLYLSIEQNVRWKRLSALPGGHRPKRAAGTGRRRTNVQPLQMPQTKAASSERDADSMLTAPHDAAGQMQSVTRRHQYESLRDSGLIEYL
jgi:hypothetical protein